jgi:hypothetical protein
MTTLTLEPAARSAEIARYPGAAEGFRILSRWHRCSLSDEKQLYQPERRHRPYHTPSAPTSITRAPAIGKQRAVNLMTQLNHATTRQCLKYRICSPESGSPTRPEGHSSPATDHRE